MLVETELSAGPTAGTLGFEDMQPVARRFRAGKGLSPLACRKTRGRKHAGRPHS
jgi:transcriptional regulator GlxA family with amidase domain